jgi:hypothetical protein
MFLEYCYHNLLETNSLKNQEIEMTYDRVQWNGLVAAQFTVQLSLCKKHVIYTQVIHSIAKTRFTKAL